MAKVLWAQEGTEIPRIAVLDLKAEGMAKSEVTIMSDRLRAELFKTGAFKVMERGQMDAVMKEQGFQQSGVCTDEECLIEMGQLLGVEKMVAGSMGKLGALYMINLRMIDMATGTIEKTVSEDCECRIEELIGSLEKVARQLAGKEKTKEKESTKAFSFFKTSPPPVAAPHPSSPTPKPAVSASAESPGGMPKTPTPFLMGKKRGVKFYLTFSRMANPTFRNYLDALKNNSDNISFSDPSSNPDFQAPKDWGSLPGVGSEFKMGIAPSFYLVLGFEFQTSKLALNFSRNNFLDEVTGFNIQNFSQHEEWGIVMVPIKVGGAYSFGNQLKFSAGGSILGIPAFLSYQYSQSLVGGGIGPIGIGEVGHEENVPASSFGLGVDLNLGMEYFLNSWFSVGGALFFRVANATSFYGTFTTTREPLPGLLPSTSDAGSVTQPKTGDEVVLAKDTQTGELGWILEQDIGGGLEEAGINLTGGGINILMSLSF